MTDSTDNARGPERIWTFCPECGSKGASQATITHRICNDCGQEWHTDLDYTSVCQSNLRRFARRADLLGAVKVKPLEWKNGHAHGIGHHYFTRNGCLYRGEASGETGLHCGPAWEIEKVAQSDYETRIRSALEPTAPSPDVLDDPRVLALVEATLKLASAIDRMHNTVGISWSVRDALIETRADLARITDTGGKADG